VLKHVNHELLSLKFNSNLGIFLQRVNKKNGTFDFRQLAVLEMKLLKILVIHKKFECSQNSLSLRVDCLTM
jgi:hypothetical protein